MTREVMTVVEDRFPDHFGTLDAFAWPVSRPDAEAFFQRFLDERLDLFGPFQDAIVMGEPALYHSLVSPLLNIGLLDPLSMCQAAERRWRDGKARLNSVEGFIRQIIGWREFLYQVYHHRMPGYLGVNHFDADLPLPRFYWEPDDTDMACVRDAVAALRANGINHHIQRLMVTGNFALIAGIRPQEVNEWYWLAYADAYEWVVSPNVLGMALYADGGVFATKPYAASANYINRMSDCCKHCRYDHRDATSGDGCPFNALYWDFLYRNRERLGANHRMARIYSTMDRKKDLAAIRRRASTLRERLRAGDRV
jgi:deoxyribodipyrimidine photolyase-related protein